MSPAPLYVRVVDSQPVFGIHRATVYRWAAAGLIRIHKRGSASFLSVAEMKRLIEGDGNEGDDE